jgi:hypothetical protein
MASRSLHRPTSPQTIGQDHHGLYFLVLRVFVVFFVPPLAFVV